MSKRSDIPLRVLIVASANARRATLGDTASRALNGRVSVIFDSRLSDSRLSPERFAAAKPDIVVADLDNPAAAAEMVQFLAGAPAGTGSVALIDEPEPRWVQAALDASINAILARNVTPDDLQLAFQAAEAGFVLLHPTSVRGLAPETYRRPSFDEVAEDLTARESEILRLASMGLGNKDIAARLAISEHTVKFHMSSILGKLNAASRTEAVSLGIRRGLIPI
jgi:DNA-binding NarL/FixJ family response regulator